MSDESKTPYLVVGVYRSSAEQGEDSRYGETFWAVDGEEAENLAQEATEEDLIVAAVINELGQIVA